MSIYKHIISYYRAERISNIVYMLYGAAVATGSTIFYLWRQGQLSLGLLLGLAVIGSFQIIVGAVRSYRTFQNFKDADASWNGNQQHLKNEEMQRLQHSEAKYQGLRNIETGGFMLAMSGLIAAVVFGGTHVLIGTLAGLTLHTAVIIAFDLFRQYRIQEYVHHLQKL